MSTKLLTDKTILFLSIQSFNYEVEICNEMERQGADVIYYDERPSNSNFTKGIIRLKRNLYQKTIDKYYRRILEATEGKEIHFLFVLRGEVVPKFFLEIFKEVHPNCVLIFYTWDSINNHAHCLTILDYFDSKFTFDPNDAAKFNLMHRPLFCIKQYQQLSSDEEPAYKTLFIGTAHTDRYSLSEKISQVITKYNYKPYTYYFMHSWLVLMYKKYIERSIDEINPSKISYTPLSTLGVIDLYKKSDIIIDIQHPGQSGLTMRTFEALGARKKLITTNKNIANYKFYDEDNILIIDRFNPEISKRFLETKSVGINYKVIAEMTLSNWIKDVFSKSYTDNWLSYAQV